MHTPSLEQFVECDLDSSELNQVRDMYASLEGYYSEIAKHGQIDRAQAKALVEDCGVTFGPNYPLQSFTSLPTRVNHGIALESIGATAVRLIGEFIQKAVDLLIRLIDWLANLIRQRKERDRRAQDVAKNIAAVDSANKELVNVGADSVGITPSTKSIIEEHEQKLAGAQASYYNYYSALSDDVLRNGKLSQTMRSLNVLAITIGDVVLKKLQLFDEVIRKHAPAGREESAAMAMIGQLRTVAMPYPKQVLLRLLPDVAPSDGVDSDILDIVSSFAQSIAAAKNERPDSDDALSVEAAGDLMSNNRNSNTLPYRLDPETQDRQLGKIKHALRALKQFRPSAAASDDIRNAYSAAMLRIQRECQALELMSVASERLSVEYDNLLTLTLSVTIHRHNLLAAKGSTSGNEEMRQSVNVTKSNLHRKLH